MEAAGTRNDSKPGYLHEQVMHSAWPQMVPLRAPGVRVTVTEICTLCCIGMVHCCCVMTVHDACRVWQALGVAVGWTCPAPLPPLQPLADPQPSRPPLAAPAPPWQPKGSQSQSLMTCVACLLRLQIVCCQSTTLSHLRQGLQAI